MNKNKVKKLIKQPVKFFQDMFLKHRGILGKAGALFDKKSNNQFTIVSACYNSALYLDDFFKSLECQSVSFRRNIYCIMVDDGSTDDTGAVIQKWERKYPNNIKYIRKENGGQSSARNLGLKLVRTKWVTFTDPDDFLNFRYFENIDRVLTCNCRKSLSLIGSNIVFYFEDKNKYSDTHPLRFKFKTEETKKIKDARLELQLSAASALFRSDIILSNNLQFDDRVKPNFEDAHFILNYLGLCQNDEFCFVREAKYFYRKRALGNSTLDKSWTDKKNFYDVLKYGKLDVLKKYGNANYTQNIVLYDLYWYVKALVNKKEKLNFLNEEEKSNYLQLLDECFSYISEENIYKFNLAGCWFYHKVGILNCFKSIPFPRKQIIYVESYDAENNEVKIRYFTGKVTTEEFMFDGIEEIPVHCKTVRDEFLNRTFVLQRILWVRLPKKFSKFTCRINENFADINVNYKNIRNSAISYDQLLVKKQEQSKIWIFMDREIQADDNAEHLYRYAKSVDKEHELYFVLERSSRDWDRLSSEGFKLLAYGSEEHEILLRKCDVIISSHIDQYIVNYFKDNSTDNKKIVFLQHGVITCDLSGWLNTKKRVDLFVTSTEDEYNSIVSDYTKYRFTDKEVKLLGLPRHDALVKGN